MTDHPAARASRNTAALYDWMTAELADMADEISASVAATSGSAATATLMRQTTLTIARYVSETRGSGAFDLIAALMWPKLVVDRADWPVLDAYLADAADRQLRRRRALFAAG